MNRFAVIVYTVAGHTVRYCALGRCSGDIACDAFDQFGVCSLCVRPL